MGAKRNLFFAILIAAFGLSYLLQQKVFVDNSAQVRPEVMVALANLPETLGALTQSVKLAQAPTPTPSYPEIPVFPTGQMIVGDGQTAQYEDIVYPTTPPVAVYEEPEVIIYTEPTPVVLPTIIYYPTATPQPTPYPTAIPTNPPYYPPVYPTTPPPPTATRIPTRPPTPTTPPSQPTTSLADFGRCLNEKGMVMYSQPSCPACAQQRTLLGAGYSAIKVISCPQQPAECQKIGVRTTPTWAKNGVMVIPGMAQLDYLAYVSGCQLPQ